MNPAKNNPAADIADRELVIFRTLNAPRALVFKAMTDPAQVVKWWGPNGFSTKIAKMDFRVGGKWEHVMTGPDGTNFDSNSVFTEIVENERVCYTHSGGKEGTPAEDQICKDFIWTFEDAGAGKTKITMRLIFGSQAARDKAAKEFGLHDGANQTLARLEDYAASVHNKPFIISRVFKAPRPLLYKVWTEKEHFTNWYGPKGFTIKSGAFDLRPGGTYHYCMVTPQGQEMWGKAYYRDVVKDQRLVWVSTFSDAEGGLGRHPFAPDWPRELLTIVTFEDHPDGTKVTINWTPMNATETELNTFEAGRDSMKGGWGGTFEQLENYLAAM